MDTCVNTEKQTSMGAGYGRKKWFLNLQKVIKIFIRSPKYVYLGEKPRPGCIILSNHESATVPLTLEMHSGLPTRFWGAYQMNKNFKFAYQYQSVTYYHEKKHWPLLGARAFCLIATPLTRLFYKGLDLISTYPDARFKNTLVQSMHVLRKGYSLVIFPENSDKGYLKELTEFRQGAIMLLECCQRQKLDVPVYVAYYQKERKCHVFDAPTTVGALMEQGLSREELARQLCSRCNELGRMEF